MSVVDGRLKVYGAGNLRIADAISPTTHKGSVDEELVLELCRREADECWNQRGLFRGGSSRLRRRQTRELCSLEKCGSSDLDAHPGMGAFADNASPRVIGWVAASGAPPRTPANINRYIGYDIMNKPFLTGLKGLFLTSLITTQTMAKAPASVSGMSSKQSTIWTGRAISMLVVLALLTDAVVNLLAPERIANEVIATGFKISQTPGLGSIVFFCALLYALPRTAVLGAILVTRFLGGAICTHFRLGDVFSPPQIVGLVL